MELNVTTKSNKQQKSKNKDDRKLQSINDPIAAAFV